MLLESVAVRLCCYHFDVQNAANINQPLFVPVDKLAMKMTAEVSQTATVPSSETLPSQQEVMEKMLEETVLEEARSIFRKFSMSLGSRKNSTKSLKSLESVVAENNPAGAQDITQANQKIWVKDKSEKNFDVPHPGPDAPRGQEDGGQDFIVKDVCLTPISLVYTNRIVEFVFK